MLSSDASPGMPPAARVTAAAAPLPPRHPHSMWQPHAALPCTLCAFGLWMGAAACAYTARASACAAHTRRNSQRWWWKAASAPRCPRHPAEGWGRAEYERLTRPRRKRCWASAPRSPARQCLGCALRRPGPRATLGCSRARVTFGCSRARQRWWIRRARWWSPWQSGVCVCVHRGRGRGQGCVHVRHGSGAEPPPGPARRARRAS